MGIWNSFKNAIGKVGSKVNQFANWGSQQISAFTGDAAVQAQQKANQDNMNFSREMYAKQRADALADVDAANRYNSPDQVMQRLKEAGLNPNLAYGGGGTSAPSAMVRASSAGSANQQAAVNPMGGAIPVIMGILGQFTKLANTQAQTSNTLALEKLNEQKILTTAQDLLFKKEMTENIKTRNSFLPNMLKLGGDKLEGEIALNNSRQNEIEERIRQTMQIVKNLEIDEKIKNVMEENLKKHGKIIQSELDIYEYLPKGSADWMKILVSLLLKKR